MFASGTTLFCAFTAALSSLLFGLNVSIVDAPGPLFTTHCPKGGLAGSGIIPLPPCFPLSSLEWSLTVSIMCIGALVAALCSGILIDKFGRKLMLWMNDLLYIAGFLLGALSVNFISIFISRILVGLAIGMTSVAVPTYLNEISTSKNRGTIGSFHQLLIVSGVLLGQLLGIGMAKMEVWRGMWLIGAVIAGIQAICMIWVVESPKWLACKAANADMVAKINLKLYGSSVVDNDNDEQQRADASLLNASSGSSDFMPAKKVESIGVWKLITNTSVAKKSLFLAVFGHFAQQLSGINAVLNFSSVIFSSSPIPAAYVSAMIGGILVLFTLVSMWCLDRFGRRPLLLVSGGGVIITLITLAFAMYHSISVLSIIATLGYIAFFALGFGPIPWLIISEIFPTESVGAASSIGVSVNWMCNFVVAMTYIPLKAELDSWVFIPYAAAVAFFFIYALFGVPETKGRPVGYIQ